MATRGRLTGTPEAAPREATPAARRLRVVRVYYHLEVGGIESRLLDLLPRLAGDRFEVRMICTRRAGRLAPELEARGVPVTVCRFRSRLPLFLAALPLARELRRIAPDVVHAHGEVPAHAATVAARRAGVPIVIANFHSVQLFSKNAGRIRRERRQAPLRDAVIHVSESAREDYDRRVGPGRARGVVLYNGVDVARFAAPLSGPRRSELARELGIEGACPVLLKAARFHRAKAHEDLLAAFVAVRRRHPRAVLVLAGDGRRRDEVEAAVARLDLAGSVRLIGLRADLRDVYQLATLHAVSSTREGFSNVVLEAMAAGLPQVLTDVGGNREAIGDSGAALLVPPGQPPRLAEALLAVLDDPGRARAMGAAARRRVERFSIDEQVRRTERLYVELARDKGLL